MGQRALTSAEGPSRPRRFDVDRFHAIADRMAPDFIERTRPMAACVRASILFSDAFCICALCDMCDVDYVVESGTGYGGSTEMLARHFAGDNPVRKIWSVDLAVGPLHAWTLRWFRYFGKDPHVWSTATGAQQQARERLAPFPHVELAYGDGLLALPRRVRTLTEQQFRVGVLIDGPKEAAQLRLAEQLLESSPLVCFAAIDDIAPYYDNGRRYSRFLGSRYAAFATSDGAFFNRYSHVNAGRLPKRVARVPDHTGHGLGILINTQSAQESP